MKQPTSFGPDALALAQTLNTLANTVAAYSDVHASEVGATPSLEEGALQYQQPERDPEELYSLASKLGHSGLGPLVVGFARERLEGAEGRESLVARPDTGSLLQPRRSFRGSAYFSVLSPQGSETTYAISANGRLRRDHGDSVLGQPIEGEEQLRVLTALEQAVPHSRFMEDVRTAQGQQQVRIARWAARPIELMFQRGQR